MKASEGSKCYWKKKKHNVAIKGEPFTVFIQYTHTHTSVYIRVCVVRRGRVEQSWLVGQEMGGKGTLGCFSNQVRCD